MIERLRRWREGLRQRRTTNALYRMLVGFTGGLVLAGGILAIPYPGPGWAIVFVGLAILASEFAWARHTLKSVKDRYDRFMKWFAGRPKWMRATGTVLTTVLVVGTLWMIGALDMMAGWVGFEQAWLQSPIGIGS